VDAISRQRVQVHGQRGDQSLAFARFHFRNLAFVEDDAADELHIEMPHIQRAAAGFADHGKGFGQDLL
jgi:hypothetical protein